MKHIRTLLLDALMACRSVGRTTSDVTVGQYALNEEKQAAVERWLILIGEALNQASLMDPTIAEQLPELRRIVGLRNRLVHGYAATDQAIVWDVATNKIPVLRAQLERLLPDDRSGRAPLDESTQVDGERMNPLITNNLEAIRMLCREYGVRRLEVFGSAVTSDFELASSDVDFIIDYPPDYDFGHFLERYFGLKDRLEALLGRPVDLVMVGAMKPRFVAAANETRRLLYEA